MAQAEAVAIDIHHHYVPASLVEEAKRHGKTLGVEVVDRGGDELGLSYAGGPAHTTNRDLMDLERRLAMMEAEKIAIATLEPHTAALGYRLKGPQGETWCRLYNEGMRDLINKHPDRFVGLAAVPLQDPPRAASVLEHAVRELNFSGAYMGSNVNGQYYDGSFFDPFWSKAEELDACAQSAAIPRTARCRSDSWSTAESSIDFRT
jgi:predicted TIM-barrel fold metal-dependent hydrolase